MRAPTTPASPQTANQAKILVPVRFAAWLSGDLGRHVEASLKCRLDEAVGATPSSVVVRRLPRALLVEGEDLSHLSPGASLDLVHGAIQAVVAEVAAKYPVFTKYMGALWTGTLQVVYPEGPAAQVPALEA